MIIDFNNLINKLLPISKRKDRVVAFLYLILHPIKTINILFDLFKKDIDYKLIFNGQVIYLEHYLNDLYDNTNRGIYIVDGSRTNQNYVYNRAEQIPSLVLYNRAENTPVYFINNNEVVEEVNFIIKVPSSVVFNEKIMREQIDIYKSAGKKYIIETF